MLPGAGGDTTAHASRIATTYRRRRRKRGLGRMTPIELETAMARHTATAARATKLSTEVWADPLVPAIVSPGVDRGTYAAVNSHR